MNGVLWCYDCNIIIFYLQCKRVGPEYWKTLKASIINGLAYTGLRNANCEGDDTELLDDLHSLLKESSASQPNPSTSHVRETIHDGLSYWLNVILLLVSVLILFIAGLGANLEFGLKRIALSTLRQ